MTVNELQLAERAAERRRSAVPRYRDEIRRVFDRLRDDPESAYHEDAERFQILDVLVRWRFAEVGATGEDHEPVRETILETLSQWLEYGYRTVQRLIRDGVSPDLLTDTAGGGRDAVVRAAFAGFPKPGSRDYLRVLIEREIRIVGDDAKQAEAEGRTAVAGEQWFDGVSCTCRRTSSASARRTARPGSGAAATRRTRWSGRRRERQRERDGRNPHPGPGLRRPPCPRPRRAPGGGDTLQNRHN